MSAGVDEIFAAQLRRSQLRYSQLRHPLPQETPHKSLSIVVALQRFN